MEKRKLNKISIIGGLIGHAIERYDTSLFAYFSHIIGTQFYGSGETNNSILVGFGFFAISYLARPFGGMFFGYLGDKFGRKKAFTYSILMIFIPMLIITFLPTYKHIGFWAPTIVIILRLMQGISAGGEESGAVIFTAEHTYEKDLGLWGSIVCCVGLLGGLIATFIGVLFTLEGMPEWGWRIPFFLGILTVIWAYFIRKKGGETPAFLKHSPYKNLFLFHLKSYIKPIVGVALMGGCATAFHYISTLFFINFYTLKFELDSHDILKINSGVLCVWILIAPLSGKLSDLIGMEKLMKITSLLLIPFTYVLFTAIEKSNSIQELFLYQILFSVVCANYTVPLYGTLIKLFPISIRYRGIAMSLTIGKALLGATAPIISTYLLNQEKGIDYVVFYVMFLALIGFIGVFMILSHTRILKKPWLV